MATQSKCFFPFTREFSGRVGNMASFVWASYCGLWHIHRRATALAQLSTHPDWKKIEHYLVDDVPDRGGIDLKQVTSKIWIEHQADYSDFILTQGAILYEEWCGQLALMTNVIGKRVNAETFQFPSGSSSFKWTNWGALDTPGTLQESSFLKNEVQPALLATYASNVTNLDAFLRWYRFFKEARNSMIHHGGIARAENVTAYTRAIVTPLKSVGMKRDFGGMAPAVGAKLIIALTDAVLLLGIVQRLAYAFDAKYCHTSQAETDLKARIKMALSLAPAPKQAIATRKANWIKNFLSHRGGITPKSLAAAEQWLKANGLVSIRAL